MRPPIPSNETARLAALRRFELLDTEPEPGFDRLTRLAARLLGAPVALISLVDENRQWFKSRLGLGLSETTRDHAFCAYAIDGEDVLVVADTLADARFRDNPLVTGAPHVRFYAGAPLRSAEGLAIGTLCVFDQVARSGLSPEESEQLRELAALAMVQIELRQAASYRHAISGLPNRIRLCDDLDAVLSDPAQDGLEFAVLVMDVAAPHQYTDLIRTLGHATADAFELASAKRIAALLPPQTRLYHLSSGRFGCVLPADAGSGLEATLDRLAEVLRQPVDCRDIPVATSVGIGVAYHPQHGRAAVDLLRSAASGAFRSMDEELPWCAYTEEMDRAARRAAHLLRDIGAALIGGEQLHLVYQPKTDLRTGRCIGAEALLRWTHPTLGPVSPSEFVPLVERTALVHALTDWALDAALAQVARWRAAGRALQISINVSMLDLADVQFTVRLARLLERHHVEPAWIDIEVTESALMKDSERVGRQLAEIRRLGIDIEIDDFGTGQSALSYLKHIPATYVKIDQMFVRDLTHDRADQSMVRSTIELVHELGHHVVAEGIDDPAVHAWLRDHGCDIGQGFAIAPPLEVDAFEAWLDARG